MTVTFGGSSGIKRDPSLETRRGEEKNLKEWRLEFLEIQKTEQEEAKITQSFLRKIKSHIDGKSEGEDLQLENMRKKQAFWLDGRRESIFVSGRKATCLRRGAGWKKPHSGH